MDVTPLFVTLVAGALPRKAEIAAWADRALVVVRAAVRYVAAHTGLPVALVAATLLVLSLHLARKTARFLLECAVAAAAIAIATHFGWISW